MRPLQRQRRRARRWTDHLPHLPWQRRGHLSASVSFGAPYLQPVRRTWPDYLAAPAKSARAKATSGANVSSRSTFLPASTEGTQLRLSQEGQPGVNGGPPGDLYVVLKVKGHPIFERHEDNLHCTVPYQRGAGGAVSNRSIFLRLTACRRSRSPKSRKGPGQRLRIKGIGVPHVNAGSGRGDHIRSPGRAHPPPSSRAINAKLLRAASASCCRYSRK